MQGLAPRFFDSQVSQGFRNKQVTADGFWDEMRQLASTRSGRDSALPPAGPVSGEPRPCTVRAWPGAGPGQYRRPLAESESVVSGPMKGRVSG